MAELSKAKLNGTEIHSLAVELNGFSNPANGEKVIKGVLGSAGVPFNVKYRLTRLLNKLEEEKTIINKLREELIDKLGTPVGGDEKNKSIPETIKKGKNDAPNPVFQEFVREYKSILNEEREFEFAEVTVSDLENLESEESYPVLCKHILTDK